MKESIIQSQIIDYLLYLENTGKILFHRSNNIPVYDPVGKRFRAMPKGTKKGFPDIVVIKKGQFIGLEVKGNEKYLRDGKTNKKGDWKKKQSKDQVEFENLVKKNGGQYYVVRELKEVIDIMEK